MSWTGVQRNWIVNIPIHNYEPSRINRVETADGRR